MMAIQMKFSLSLIMLVMLIISRVSASPAAVGKRCEAYSSISTSANAPASIFTCLQELGPVSNITKLTSGQSMKTGASLNGSLYTVTREQSLPNTDLNGPTSTMVTSVSATVTSVHDGPTNIGFGIAVGTSALTAGEPVIVVVEDGTTVFITGTGIIADATWYPDSIFTGSSPTPTTMSTTNLPSNTSNSEAGHVEENELTAGQTVAIITQMDGSVVYFTSNDYPNAVWYPNSTSWFLPSLSTSTSVDTTCTETATDGAKKRKSHIGHGPVVKTTLETHTATIRT